MYLLVCLLVLLVPVTSGPTTDRTDVPATRAPVHEVVESMDKLPDNVGDRSKVTIQAGHYRVTLDQEILEMITDFFNSVDTNEDDVLDSSELEEQWEQLDVDSNDVLSSDEIHGKLTWFELYALDVDGDGVATSNEFERATRALDIDGNGKVEFNEFIVKTGLVRNQNLDSHNSYRR